MIDHKPNAQISALLREHIAVGDFPSAVYVVAEGGRIMMMDALGNAVCAPVQHAATVETIYDVASLTKPLVTTLLCAQQIERGALKLDAAVAHYLPEYDRPDKGGITVRQLLTHTSGLPAWRPLYILTQDHPEGTLAVIADQPLAAVPGAGVIYSDLGFITLGFLLERLTTESLTALAHKEIFARLNLQRTFFNPPQTMRSEMAACESAGNAYERELAGTVADRQQFANWRERLIWGEVHDGNAYLLGGAAGHAGLFSTVSETLRIAEQFVAERTALLAPQTCEMFSVNMTEGLNEARSIGWQLAATAESSAGSALPLNSFGHTGFTGTSCWICPPQSNNSGKRIFVLFTNRTHAHTLPFANINSVRRRFHTLAVAKLDEESGSSGSENLTVQH